MRITGGEVFTVRDGEARGARTQGRFEKRDVYIGADRTFASGPAPADDEVIDASGRYVIPGKDKQEADLKKFYLPDHADFGLDTPADFGTLTYYDDEGHYHEESVKTVAGDNGRYYDCLFETIVNGAEPLVTEEQTMAQMRLLEEATNGLR